MNDDATFTIYKFNIMKLKLLILSVSIVFQFAHSQTEKPWKGKVTSEGFPVRNAEIVNLRSKKTTITNENGEFSILAKAKDTLMFIAKNYQYKKKILEKDNEEKTNLLISLVRKPEELEEVIVLSKKSFTKIKFDKNIASQLTIEKAAINKKPIGIHDGTIENGRDLIEIGAMIIDFFKKEKEDKKESVSKGEFKELARTNLNDNFFINTLKLKPEEIELFLDFCDVDTKSKTVLENSNPLKLLDFILNKSEEFKKLNASENK